MHTELLRHQHREINGIINGMRRNLLAPQRMSISVAENLGSSLDTLALKLKSHLSIEDKGVYPKLNVSTISNGASTSRKFAEEMDRLRAQFQEFRTRWPTAEAIHAQPIRFVDECTTIFHMITRRIDQEEKELYPLVDALP
jgi:hemerythrin-like domain-containing protein